jgi:hypothetical protein
LAPDFGCCQEEFFNKLDKFITVKGIVIIMQNIFKTLTFEYISYNYLNFALKICCPDRLFTFSCDEVLIPDFNPGQGLIFG